MKYQEAYERKSGVCYVAELSNEAYTHDQLVELCTSNGYPPDMVDMLWEELDWQHPETIIAQWEGQ